MHGIVDIALNAIDTFDYGIAHTALPNVAFVQKHQILDSIVVSIPACHAGDRGSIPRRGDTILAAL